MVQTYLSIATGSDISRHFSDPALAGDLMKKFALAASLFVALVCACQSTNNSSYQNQNAAPHPTASQPTNSARAESPTIRNSQRNPTGATARCRDGTLSYSQHHRGTCSHHGGVAQWLD